jgi:hypothetical protein
MSGPSPRMAIEGAGAAVAALVVMAALSALAVAQLGVGSVPAMAAAVVTLAVGGSVDLEAGGPGPGSELGASLQGTLDLTPIGVSVAGAVVLVLVFRAPLRRRTPTPEELIHRAGAALGTFLVGIAVLALLGKGRLPLDRLGLDRGGDSPLGGLRERLGGNRGGDGDPGGVGFGERAGEVTFAPDVLLALVTGLCWVLVVLGLGWLASRRAPLPPGWIWAHRFRPALWATATVLVVFMSLGTVVGLVLLGLGGPVTGGLLLGAATVVLLALTLGIGVPWSASASGSLAELLPADRVPDGDLRLGTLVNGRGGVVVLVAVLTLLACGLLAAARGPAAPAGRRLRHAAAAGGRLGIVVALAMTALTLLAGISVDFGVSAFGVELLGTEVRLHANTLLAAGLGLTGGAVAGFVGSCVVRGGE